MRYVHTWRVLHLVRVAYGVCVCVCVCVSEQHNYVSIVMCVVCVQW